MEKTILQKSHEDYWLRAGDLLGLQFDKGWCVMRITGREPSNLQHILQARLAALSNLTQFNELQDASANRYPEPYDEPYLHQYYWGVSPPAARVFFQYPTREDRWSLTSLERTITGLVGFVDGYKSPFEGPFSPMTECWGVHELFPAFNVYNPTSQRVFNIKMAVDFMRYTYKVVTDKEEVRQILLGIRPRHMFSMAGIDPRPAISPAWLERLNYDANKRSLWEFTRKGMEEGVWA